MMQLDIRDYWKPGGHKPVDQSLINRTMSAVHTALAMSTSATDTGTAVSQVRQLDRKGDYISRPSAVTAGTDHLLGPLIASQTKECSKMIFKTVRDLIGSTDDHCEACPGLQRARP